MVSTRKNANEKLAGPSKKRGRTDDKDKAEQNLLPVKKKRERKPKTVKVDGQKHADYENDHAVSKIVKEVEKEHSDYEIDHDIIEKIEDDIGEEPPEIIVDEPQVGAEKAASDLPMWPYADMQELLRRLENALPPRDVLLYKSRVDKVDWNEIAFGDYSGIDCRLMWAAIQKRIRRFRILRELVEDAKEWILKPWTNFYRGNKTNRHPDMPRRPLSTYMLFYLNKKDKVLLQNPGLEMTDLSKIIAEMYKELTPEAKEKYNNQAHVQRKQYEDKLAEFYRIHPDMQPNNVRSNLHAINDHIPKKPSTPFKLFCEDKLKRSETEHELDKAVFADSCKEQWRTMSDKKKVFWINWASDKEAKYQEELKKYKAENPNFVLNSSKSILTKEERTIRERMAGKPEKPPNSSYSLFSRLMLASEDVKAVNPKDRMMLIATRWKSLSDPEKKEYGDRVKHMLEQYKLQYAEYLESLSEDKRREELLNNQPRKKTTRVTKPKAVATVVATTVAATTELGAVITGTIKGVRKSRKTTKPRKIVSKADANQKPVTKKNDNLYDGEPEPPPATPYLLFVKSYQENYPNQTNAHDVWDKMGEDQRNFHRNVLWDMKRVYIESYENFLKGLTQEELKEYSEWKKTVKLANHDDDCSSDDNSDSDEDCSSNSDSDNDEPLVRVKREITDDSSSSE